MTTKLSWYSNPVARTWQSNAPVDDIAAFHRSLPGYAPTPLVELPEIAAQLGVGRVFIKDESSRLGLPAFKILGASYAISRALSAVLGETSKALELGHLQARLAEGKSAAQQSAAHEPVEQQTLQLVAATDGNHGRAVAHVARLLGLPARIFVPTGLTAQARSAIVSEGAELNELELPYDEVVAAAASAANDAGDSALLIQDTAWEGYEDIPQWIVDGYSTLFEEADSRLTTLGLQADVVVVPVGVGSLAQAAVVHYRAAGSSAPVVLSVEPESAPAIIASLDAGEPLPVETSRTIMAGLNCGTVSGSAWPVLHQGLDAAVTVSEADAYRAVVDLQDQGVDAGPCGAATLAGARAVLTDHVRRADVQAASDTVVLLLSTEGLSANPIDLNRTDPGQA